MIGNGRAAALEVLLDTPRIKDLVKKGDIENIKDAMEQGTNEGCCSFDQALFDLVTLGRIDETEAVKAADSPNNLRLQIERYRRNGVAPSEESQLRLVQPSKPVVRPSPVQAALQRH
jgi:twitching motility protein PilU